MPPFSLADALSPAGLATLAQVAAIDLMLAGDNVVILGTLAAGLPPAQRKRVLAIGIGLALICLIGFAWFATMLLSIVGLLFAGGVLLLWVSWRLWRELRHPTGASTIDGEVAPAAGIASAVVRVAVADLSMSLDNVLAVAGAARDHPTVLVIGLALSVTLVAVAANAIARLIERHRWIAYGGLAMILYVALSMIHRGIVDPAIGIGRLLGGPA